MNNYFFCDNNEETIEFLLANGWENHINTDQVNDAYLMCFFNTGSPNRIFAIDLSYTRAKKSDYIGNGIAFITKHALLSSLGMSLQEIIDTCEESSDVVNS